MCRIEERIKMRSDNKVAHRTGNWLDFVEMNKFFGGPTKRSVSLPCLGSARQEKNANKLSLSWQLAMRAEVPRQAGGQDQDYEETLLFGTKRKLLKKRKHHTHRRHGKGSRGEPMVVKRPTVMVMDANDYATTKTHPVRTKAAAQGSRRQQQQLEQYRQLIAQQYQEQQQQQYPLQYPQPYPPPQHSGKQSMQPEHPVKPHRSLAVPLCERPTIIMSPNNRAAQQYQDQLQYQYQLEQQQELYQQQLAQYYQTQALYGYQPYGKYLMHARPQPNAFEEGPVYQVPMDSPYAKPKKGRRYVGNFYYR